MTELEPVAWAWRNAPDDRFVTTLDEPQFAWEKQPLVTLPSAQSAIAERDARIAELEAENAALAAHACVFLDGSGVTGDEHGNSVCMLSRRLEASEALLKEAGKVLEPFAKLGDIVLAEAPADSDEVNLYVDCEDNIHWVRNEAFRAARSLMSKIGERNGE